MMFKRYFPTQLLITGFDILFFWVARMMMMSLYFTGRAPFRIVYLHALIRDAKGRKMSKSLGNVVDPIALMDRYGCDALRFTLASQAVPGRDLRLSEKRIEGNRNFITKLWNSARFLEMHGCRYDEKLKVGEVKGAAHRWILMGLRKVAAEVEEDLRDEVCLFHEASAKLYHFLWGVFCDQYLEMIKPALVAEGREREEARAVSAWVMYGVLRLLHPFVPFVTEKIFQESKIFALREGVLLMTARALRAKDITSGDWKDDVEEVGWILGLIDKVRSTRSALGLSPQVIVPWFGGGGDSTKERLERWSSVVRAMAGVAWQPQRSGEQRVVGFVYERIAEPKFVLPEGVDLNAMRERLLKQVGDWINIGKNSSMKLENRKFTDNAPREILEAERTRFDDATTQTALLSKILKEIEDMMKL